MTEQTLTRVITQPVPTVGFSSDRFQRPGLSPVRRMRLDGCEPDGRFNCIAELRKPVFGFLSPSDSIRMHADTVIHDVGG